MLVVSAWYPFSFLPFFVVRYRNQLLYYYYINTIFCYVQPQPITKIFDSLNILGSAVSFKWLNSTLYSDRLLTFFYNYWLPVWTRVIFRGKSYRIRNFKTFKKITFNFGHSHWTKFKFFHQDWSFFKRKRQSYVLISWNTQFLAIFKQILPHVRTMNKYTKRGLRLKQQPFVRRFGKISQMVSSLHAF